MSADFGATERPFRAVVPPRADHADDHADDPEPVLAHGDDEPADWSVDDIEAAYQRALAAADELQFIDDTAAADQDRGDDDDRRFADHDLTGADPTVSDARASSSQNSHADAAVVDAADHDAADRDAAVRDAASSAAGAADRAGDDGSAWGEERRRLEHATDNVAAAGTWADSGATGADSTAPSAAAPSSASDGPASQSAPPSDEPPRITPRQIVEVFLFVGGRPLTVKQLADLLGGSVAPEHVERWIDDLNREYQRQRRPYEIRLHEGGYRLDLRPEHDKVRARVFGIGPREVKLAQNALEALAFVAYEQPTTRSEVEAAGIPAAAGLLRQLLRRELIALERSAGDDEPTYRTTPRFLELFGLRSLQDLPRSELVNRR